MNKSENNLQVRAATLDDAREFLAELQREDTKVAAPNCPPFYKAIKRLFDILTSIVALILLSPLFLFSAILVFLSSPGPIFFRQERAGKNGKSFTMFKFRTMHLNAEKNRQAVEDLNCQSGPVFKAPDDPRLIWAGKFLRRSSLDELPQLLNVLRGEMSIVGPRPLWIVEAKKAVGAARFRTAVKPGLTCIWQVSGRSELSYEQWVLLDLFYIKRRSLLLDLFIILQTIPAVLTGHGAF